jgi:hypothetical protein
MTYYIAWFGLNLLTLLLLFAIGMSTFYLGCSVDGEHKQMWIGPLYTRFKEPKHRLFGAFPIYWLGLGSSG